MNIAKFKRRRQKNVYNIGQNNSNQIKKLSKVEKV